MKGYLVKFLLKTQAICVSLMFLGSSALAGSDWSADAPKANPTQKGYFPSTRQKLKKTLNVDNSYVGKKTYSAIKRTARIAGAPVIGVGTMFGVMPKSKASTIQGRVADNEANLVIGAVMGACVAGYTAVVGGLTPKCVRKAVGGGNGSFQSIKDQN